MQSLQAFSRVALLAVVTTASALSAAPPHQPTPAVEALVTFRPYKQAVAESRRTGRPLLLFFTNPHCVPCYWLETEIFFKRDSADLVNRLFVPVRFVHKLGPSDKTPETPEARRLAARYGVQGAPRLVVVSASGQFVGSVAWLGRNEVLYRLEQYARPKGSSSGPVNTPPNPGVQWTRFARH